jgi:hypothetical protein
MVKSSMPQLLPWFQRLCSPDSMLWCQGAACRSRPFSICSRLSKRKNFKPQPEWSWKAEMLWLKFGMEVLVASSWHGIINSKSVLLFQNYLLTNLSATERLFTWAKNRVAQECIGLTWLYIMVIFILYVYIYIMSTPD